MTEVAVPIAQEQVHGKEWVRSFLFSVKIDSPLARLHVLTKLFAILILSFVVVRFIKTDDPDPVGTILMICLAFLGLYLSGVLRWVFTSYAIVMFPALFGMAFAWVVFNPSLGGPLLATIPVYSGTITLGVSLKLVIFLVFAVNNQNALGAFFTIIQDNGPVVNIHRFRLCDIYFDFSYFNFFSDIGSAIFQSNNYILGNINQSSG